MMDGENLDRRLCDDHYAGRSPLVEAAFVDHFVQTTRESVGAGDSEAQIVGKAQKMTVALSMGAQTVEVQKVGQEVGQGEGRRVR